MCKFSLTLHSFFFSILQGDLPFVWCFFPEWVKLLSRVRLFATPWTVTYKAPLSMEFSRQEYWSGLPFPSPGDLPDPGIQPGSPALQADALPSEPSGNPLLYIVDLQHCASFTQSCPTLCDPMDCSPKGSSVHGIFQARVLEWIAISFSRETIKRAWLINFGNWWNQACHKNKEIKIFFLVASY